MAVMVSVRSQRKILDYSGLMLREMGQSQGLYLPGRILGLQEFMVSFLMTLGRRIITKKLNSMMRTMLQMEMILLLICRFPHHCGLTLSVDAPLLFMKLFLFCWMLGSLPKRTLI